MNRNSINMISVVMTFLLLFQIGMPLQSFANEGSFYQRVGHPLKFFVISKLKGEDRQDFRNIILARDTEQVLTIKRPVSVADTDVVLVLLQGWNEVENLPLKEDLGGAYARIKGNSSSRFRDLVQMEFPDGKLILVVFLNDEAVKNGTRNCYAKEFIYGLTLAEGGNVFDFETCVLGGF